MDKQAIKDLFDKAGASIVQDDVWLVQGTPVVKHKALERLAGAMKIKFAPPKILRAERDEAVILVTGELFAVHSGKDNTLTEWSIGEACVNVNYLVKGKMAAYVYAMAEKRAKDRVILKLAGLHGVYSEEEADEFKGNADKDSGEEFDGLIGSTKRLLAAETSLRQAAESGGIDALKNAWAKIDRALLKQLVPTKNRLVEQLKEKANVSAPV